MRKSGQNDFVLANINSWLALIRIAEDWMKGGRLEQGCQRAVVGRLLLGLEHQSLKQ